MKDLEQARNELRSSYQGLSDEQMTRPGAVAEWSVKDVLSHIASWEEITLLDLARLARRDTPTLASFDPNEVDDWNAMLVSLWRNLPLDQVLRELDLSRRNLLGALVQLPDSALAKSQFVRAVWSRCVGHDKSHAEGIRQWRQREGL